MKPIDDQTILWDYLNKNYLFDGNQFLNKLLGYNEWGNKICGELSVIFSIKVEVCENVFKVWSRNNGVTENKWRDAWGPNKLSVRWSPEFTQDINCYPLNAETALIEQIAREIEAQILLDVKITDTNEFLSVLKCLGYEAGEMSYNPDNFTPIKHFESIPYSKMMNERQNNVIWQDYFRTRE